MYLEEEDWFLPDERSDREPVNRHYLGSLFLLKHTQYTNSYTISKTLRIAFQRSWD